MAKLNPALNFLAHDLSDQAVQTSQLRSGFAPFFGIPFMLKDLVAAMAGTPLTNGSRLIQGFVCAEDSELVARFKRAGLVVVARSASAELGAHVTTETALNGAARNPWNVALSAGGSSGGSAAAVAAGVVPLAHANDGIGSIRIPAAACGVFGLKPTRARTPAGPHLAEIGGGRVIEFAVSWSVRDSAALLDAVQGPDTGAPYWAPPAERSYLERLSGPVPRLRIAVIDRSFSGAAIDHECAEAARATARLCEQLGHDVEPATLPIDFDAYLRAIRIEGGAGLAATIDGLAATMGRRPCEATLERHTLLSYEEALTYSARDYLWARETFARLQRQIGAFFDSHDILVTPMLARPTPPLGWLTEETDDLDAYWAKFGGDAYSPFAGLFNVTGQPAASVPLHMSSAGMPIGTQLVAGFGADGLLLALCAQLEQAAPWRSRKPPLHMGSIN